MTRIKRIRTLRQWKVIVGWTIVAVNVGFVVLNLTTGNISHLTAMSAVSAIFLGLILTS